jgi:hypothetical protein
MVVLLAVLALFALVLAVPAFAEAPGGGSDFGEHVSGMAVEGHPLPTDRGGHGGQHFGDCVSDMATTGECDMMP